MYQSGDRVFPFVSLLGLFAYFLFDGFYTTTSQRMIFLVFSLVMASSDLVFRLLTSGYRTKDHPRYLAVVLVLTAFGSYVLRNWLDFPPQPGVNWEAGYLPKIREFLLAITVVVSIACVAYTALLEMGRRSLEVQSQLSDKKTNLLSQSVMGFLILVPFLVAINYVAIQRNYNFDLSSQGKFSLSEISKNLIRSLDKPVDILAFYPRPLEADGPGTSLALSRVRPDLEILLDQYRTTNPRISVRFINADVETDLLADLGQVSNGSILIRTKRDILPGETKLYNEERLTVREQSDLEDLERKLTSAILNVSTPRRNAYFTSTNGERFGVAVRNLRNEQIAQFTDSLNYLNFKINELGFAEGWPKEIPEDADLLVIAGPTVPFNETARSAILKYATDGKGKILIFAEPKGKEDFSWLLGKAGIRYVGSQISQVGAQPGVIVARNFSEHAIADFLPKKELGIVYPYAGYLEQDSGEIQKVLFRADFILETSADAYLDPLGLGREPKQGETRSFPLVAVLEPTDLEPGNPGGNGSEGVGKESGRIVVFSGTAWLTDQFVSYNMNRNFALSSVSWLFRDAIVNEIPRKKDEVQTVSLSDKQKLMAWVIGMFLFPGAVVGFGSYYVVTKRRKGEGST